MSSDLAQTYQRLLQIYDGAKGKQVTGKLAKLLQVNVTAPVAKAAADGAKEE